MKAYGLDGYVSPTTHFTAASGETGTVGGGEDVSLPPSIILFTLLGLPNRPGPGDDMMQYVRNLFGGWDSLWPSDVYQAVRDDVGDNDEHTGLKISLKGKRLWNLIFLPVKILVIFPLKLIGIPSKIAL